ncbi:ribonuclease H-like domain-containing protein [Tanacetum coccineum]
MEAGTNSTTLTAKLPILDPGEYDLWLMRIEQYFLMTDYSRWEDRRNKMKARGILLMALQNKDQLKFHSYKDAKLLMEAIEKRYGGNKESKKVQRTLLKQQYENFLGSSLETMDQTFDRLQKLISQLEIQGETISQEDMNLKLTNSNISTNEADNTTYGVSTAHTKSSPTSGDNLSDVVVCAVVCAFLDSQPNSPQMSREDLKQIDLDDLEKMDLQWEMAMLTIRARRFIKRTGRQLDVNGKRVRFDRTKVECYNCHKYGHFARECRALRNQDNRGKEPSKRTMTMETPNENALVAQDGIGGEVLLVQILSLLESQVSDRFKTGLGYNAATAASPAVESFVNSSEMLENQECNRPKGYHAVPLPYTGNFIPRKPDLTYMDEIVKSKNMDVTTV